MKLCNLSIVLSFVFLLKFTGTDGHLKPIYHEKGNKLSFKSIHPTHQFLTDVGSNQYSDGQRLVPAYKLMILLTRKNPKLLNLMPPKLVNNVLNTLMQNPSLMDQLSSDEIMVLLNAISTSPNFKKPISTNFMKTGSVGGQFVNTNNQVQSQQSPNDVSSQILTDLDQDVNKPSNVDSSMGVNLGNYGNSNNGLFAAVGAGTKTGANAGGNVGAGVNVGIGANTGIGTNAGIGAATIGGANFGFDNNKIQVDVNAGAVQPAAPQPSGAAAAARPFTCTPDVVIPSVFSAGTSLQDALKIIQCSQMNFEKKQNKPVIPLTFHLGSRFCCITSTRGCTLGPCDTTPTTGIDSTPTPPCTTAATTAGIPGVTTPSTITTTSTEITVTLPPATTAGTLPPTPPTAGSTVGFSTNPPTAGSTTGFTTTPPTAESTTGFTITPPDVSSTAVTQRPCVDTTCVPIYPEIPDYPSVPAHPVIPKLKDFTVSPALLTKVLYKIGLIAEKLQDGYTKIKNMKIQPPVHVPTHVPVHLPVHVPVYKPAFQFDHMKHFPKPIPMKKKPSHGEVPNFY